MKTFFSIILLLVLALGGWYMMSSQKLEELVISEKQIAYGSEEDKYIVDVKFPLIQKGIPKKSASLINATIESWATPQAETGRSQFLDLLKEPFIGPEYATLSDLLSYKVFYDFDFAPYINYKFEGYTYGGGAHGITGITTFVFNAKTGKQMVLDDLFVGDYLKEISDKSLIEIKKLDPDQEIYMFIEDGLKPIHENFSSWQIRPDGLLITFGDYQIGPYAAGRPDITIPWSELNSVMKPEFKATLGNIAK